MESKETLSDRRIEELDNLTDLIVDAVEGLNDQEMDYVASKLLLMESMLQVPKADTSEFYTQASERMKEFGLGEAEFTSTQYVTERGLGEDFEAVMSGNEETLEPASPPALKTLVR